MSIDTVCSAHVVEDDATSQIPSDIYPSPLTSGAMESCILNNTAYSTHVAADNMIAQVPSDIYPSRYHQLTWSPVSLPIVFTPLMWLRMM